MTVDLANPKTDVKELWRNFISSMGKHDVSWDGHGRFLFDYLTIAGWMTDNGQVPLNEWDRVKADAELLIETWVQCGILIRNTSREHNAVYYAADNKYVADILVRNGMIKPGNYELR